MSTKEYCVPVSELAVQDAAFNEERLRFHIKSGDYFGLVATVLGFIEEKLQGCDRCADCGGHSPELAMVRALRKEAQYLHQHGRITGV